MAYITRTTGSPMTNQKKFTYSAWLKITDLGTYQRPIQNYYDSNNRGYILFCSTSDSAANTFFVYDKEGGTINYQANTSAKFKDTNGWYHIVWRVDSTQATQSDRVRFYVNGELQSMSISTNCSQNVNMGFNSAGANLRIGGQESGSETWKGLMSHVHFCDGYSYAPTEFGETDSTTGEWKIKTNVSVTYGNNGFFVFKDDAAVTDRSGEGNNFTLSGSITPTQDCPSNVFATLNPLDVHPSASTSFANGATTITTNSSGSRSTLGNATGKFYAEAKISANTAWLGVQDVDSLLTTNDNATMLYPAGASMYVNGSNQGTGGYGSAWSANDIMMIAMDLDATQKKVYFGKNGGLWNGSDYSANAPTTGENLSNNTTYVYRSDSGSGTQTAYWNFGTGYFGTTAISSEGTNASGIGKFEYDVPSGYTALSTKGLNE